MTQLHQNPGASSQAIQHHYDVGNDFYAYWLDRTLSYSCALWEEGEEDKELEKAQRRKIDYHIAQAKAASTRRVLDIGCGWGGVVRRLVEAYGVERAVGLTLSAAQVQHIQDTPDPRLEVRLESWADHRPEAPYDAIISIGAFEHFARPEFTSAQKVDAYRNFFAGCHGWLQRGGQLSLQTIAYANMRPEQANQFMNTEIFPESDLPRLAEIAEAAEGLFEIVALRNDGRQYGRTCQLWLDNLRANKEAALGTVTAETVARYDRYLKLCVYGFHTGMITLYRLTLRRVDTPHR